MSFVRAWVLASVMVACGSAVFALPQPTVELAFSSGRVTLNVADASVRDVLRAWGATGHVEVTGIENLGQRRITLRLSDAPEETTLAIIVGERSWFRATARTFSGVSESAFERIEILPAARAADVNTPTPEQRYEYPQPSMTAEVASWAGQPLTSATAPREAVAPEKMYEYPSPGARFGDAFKVLPAANAPNQQTILQPGTDAPVPERLYEYPAPPNMPGWMTPPIPVPDLPVGSGFIDGVPGERVVLTLSADSRDPLGAGAFPSLSECIPTLLGV